MLRPFPGTAAQGPVVIDPVGLCSNPRKPHGVWAAQHVPSCCASPNDLDYPLTSKLPCNFARPASRHYSFTCVTPIGPDFQGRAMSFAFANDGCLWPAGLNVHYES